jgi:anti-sigma factor RsiW
MTKTVKIRIAVAVDPTGDWNAYGGGSMKDKDAMEFATEVLADGETRFWLTAELPVPEVAEVVASVEPA